MHRTFRDVALSGLLLISLVGCGGDHSFLTTTPSPDPDQAAKNLAVANRALRSSPNSIELILNQALAYQNVGDLDNAIADYDLVLKSYPYKSEALANRGQTYYRKGQYQQAIQDYTKAIDGNPKDSTLFFWRAQSYIATGDAQRA